MCSKWVIFMGLKRARLAAPVLLLALAAGAPALSAPTSAQTPQIRDLAVVEKRGQLLVFGSLEQGFSPKLFEVVHSGVTTRFIYEVGLLRSRRFFYDSEVVSRRLIHQVKYDALKKAYTFRLIRSPDEGIQKVTQSRREMEDWMTEINGAPIAPSKSLSPDARYYVRVRAKMNSVDFAFPFNYLLSFLGSQTPWAYSVHFGPKGM